MTTKLDRILGIKDQLISTIDRHNQALINEQYENEQQKLLFQNDSSNSLESKPSSRSSTASTKTATNEPTVKINLRIRPPTTNYFRSVHSINDRAILYYPSFQVLTDAGLDVHSFQFDNTFNPDSTQEQVFEKACGDLIHNLDGLNVVFAYGQTGSGKTFTMSGISKRILEYLPYDTHSVDIILLEVIGDTVRDLYTNEPIKVLMDSQGNVQLVGHESMNVENHEQALEVLDFGFKSRKTSKTVHHDVSSRSHFICQIEMTKGKKKSVLKLIDLAGSERNTGHVVHDPERIKEAAFINSSLMALKDCIRNKDGRIPIRNSKLTTLLKDAFVPGPMKTNIVMIATVSPTVNDLDHSLDTFRYAASLSTTPSVTSYKPKSSPISWSTEKLDNWFKKQDFDISKLTSQYRPVNGFIPPKWKMVYDLPEEAWQKAKMGSIYSKYKELFLKPKASVGALGTKSYQVYTIGLHVEKKPVPKKKSRQEEALEKLKQRGKAKREDAKAKEATSFRRFK